MVNYQKSEIIKQYLIFPFNISKKIHDVAGFHITCYIPNISEYCDLILLSE